MKKIKYFLVLCLGFLLFNINVFAGLTSLSVNKSSIENGSSVTATVTISNTAAWNVSINSSGATSGCSQKFVGDSGTGNNTTKSFSVTCKSTSLGIINFSISGDITSSDGANSNVSGSKSVSVVKAREKSTNNKLKNLSVEGYEISPKFDTSTKEYSVTVPSTVDKIKINATRADNYSSVTGDGEQVVEEGVNSFEIIVTSETGVSNSYKLNVTVEDINPIEVKVNGKKYTVVKVAKNLTKPELFEETTVKINDIDIPAFKNETVKYTLVGLKDDKGNISLFIYNNNKYIKYNEFTNSKIFIVLLDKNDILSGYKKGNVKINEVDTEVLINGKSIIVYGMNLLNGKKNYYSYDKNENTFQIFDSKEYLSNLKEQKQNEYLIYVLSAVCLLLIILVILFISKNNKLKKLIKFNK